jgi:phytoene dehydrogenase-like protein
LKYDAIVIGAGCNGLVVAAILAKAGRKVLIVEEREAIGGIARTLKFAPGFHVAPLGTDPGWMPPGVARLVGSGALEHAAAPLTLAVQPDEFLTLWSDQSRAAEAIARYSKRDASAWLSFSSQLRALASFLERAYERPPPTVAARSAQEFLALADLAIAFRRLGRRNMTALLRVLPMSVQDLLDDWFESEPLKAAIAPTGVQNLRQGPRSAGTALVLLHHLVGAPSGSMRRAGRWSNGDIVAGLEQTARRNGVAIRTNAKVQRVLVADDTARGVVLEDGEEIASQTVVSTADPSRTLLGMVDPVWLDPEFLLAIRNIKYRGCTAIVAYALDRLIELPGIADPAELLRGVVTLTPERESLERAYDAAKYGRVSERPHVEFTVPTLATPQHAPKTKHVLLARVQYAPYRLQENTRWDAVRREDLSNSVSAAISTVIPRFNDRVSHRAVFAPPDLEREFGLTEGAIHQGELMLDQFLFMRPVPGWAHYRTPIEGLYLCGSGTHPGGGVIGGAGYIGAHQVLRDYKVRRRTNEASE